MNKRTVAFSLIFGTLLGTAAGAGAFYVLAGPLGTEGEAFGPWTALSNIGEANQNPYTRARVALYGIWGLPPREVIYFSAIKDSAGRTLDHRCTYTVSGKPPPSRWWSVTAYRDLFYIENPANRYSLSMTTIKPNTDGSWTIRLSPQSSGENGLALGDKAGTIFLSYRLYQPLPGIAENRSRVPMPVITRIACPY